LHLVEIPRLGEHDRLRIMGFQHPADRAVVLRLHDNLLASQAGETVPGVAMRERGERDEREDADGEEGDSDEHNGIHFRTSEKTCQMDLTSGAASSTVYTMQSTTTEEPRMIDSRNMTEQDRLDNEALERQPELAEVIRRQEDRAAQCEAREDWDAAEYWAKQATQTRELLRGQA
jgi:hypothetical protein